MNELLNLIKEKDLNKYLIIKEYKKNEIIFSEGIICKYIGIVIEGTINISTITYNNNEEIINVVSKNGIFGSNLIFSSSPLFLGDIVSYTNSKIAFISKNSLEILLQNNKEFLLKYLEILSNQVLIEKNKNKLYLHKNIRDRILYYINYEKKKKGQVKIKSIAELARILSLPRPSTSREINKLIKENIIEYKNKEIILK